MPNDDCLFPRHIDMQIGMDSQNDGEWAVDKFLSHSGSKTNPIFEVKWKSGDITWLPYYQVTHLQVLTDYLELLGVDNISKLAKGTGHPPENDPQIFIGSLQFSIDSQPSLSLPNFLSLFSYINELIKLFSSFFHSFFAPPFISPTLNITYSIDMPPRTSKCINHPNFHRCSSTPPKALVVLPLSSILDKLRPFSDSTKKYVLNVKSWTSYLS